MDELREPWSGLAAQTGNVFSSWEWADLWWRRHGSGRRLAVSVARAGDGRIDAIVPLYEWATKPFRVARFLGHGPADQLGPVCAPEDRDVAAIALRKAAREGGFDATLAEMLEGEVGWGEALGSRILTREPSPVVSLEGGWEAFLARRSANFRQQVRRHGRRIARRDDFAFRLAGDRARLDADFTRFVVLHRARWGMESAFVRWESFVREFAVLAFDRGWLRLWFLERAGVPVAAWLGFRFGGVESYYQAGREPGYRDAPVGFLLLAHTIREAAHDGMREYRLLRGGEAFKSRFADRDPGVETHALIEGVRGRVAIAAVRAGLENARLRSLFRLARGPVPRTL